MPFHLSLRQPPSGDHEVRVTQKPQKTRCLAMIAPMRLGFAFLVFLVSFGSPASEAGQITSIGFNNLTITMTGPGVSLIKEWGDDPTLPIPVVPKIQPVRSYKGGEVNGQRGVPPPENPTDRYFKLVFDPPNMQMVQDNAPNHSGVVFPEGTAHVGNTSVKRDFNAGDFYEFQINSVKAEARIPKGGQPPNLAYAFCDLTNFGTLDALGSRMADRAVQINFNFAQPFFMLGPARLEIVTNLFGNKKTNVFKGLVPANFVINTHVPNHDTNPFPFAMPYPFDSSDPSSSSFGFQVEALAGVPEPSTWSLAVVGLFVGAGFVMRRRKLTPGEA
jgi:hypothetical protein